MNTIISMKKNPHQIAISEVPLAVYKINS